MRNIRVELLNTPNKLPNAAHTDAETVTKDTLLDGLANDVIETIATAKDLLAPYTSLVAAASIETLSNVYAATERIMVRAAGPLSDSKGFNDLEDMHGYVVLE